MEIELRPRTRENVRIYFRAAQDAEIRHFLPQKAKSEEEALADFEKMLLPGATSCGRSIYADSLYIGDVWAYGIGAGDPDAMLSLCIFDQAFWGKGVGTQALRLFMAGLREAYDLKTLGAFTYSDNVGSQKVLLHNGFQRQETFTEDGRESAYFRIEFA